MLAIPAALAACRSTTNERADARPVEAPAARGETARAIEAPANDAESAIEAPAIGGESAIAKQPTLGGENAPIERAARPDSSAAGSAEESSSASESTASAKPEVAAPDIATAPLERVELLVPGTTSKLVLVAIPAGAVHAVGGTARVGPFLASTTEITWDMYDAFVFAMDRAETEKDPPDAFARPSKPYILMDRGFGHAGYPVISVSFRGASEFCRWLSTKTGKRFRLPTELEWFHAASAMSPTDPANEPARLEASAWYQANSKKRGRMTTRPVGTKEPNAFGLYDVHGNAAEWAVTPEGGGVLCGGSFRDPSDRVTLRARVTDDPAFNATDPQIPKSVWWLADGPFAGFRVVCDP